MMPHNKAMLPLGLGTRRLDDAAIDDGIRIIDHECTLNPTSQTGALPVYQNTRWFVMTDEIWSFAGHDRGVQYRYEAGAVIQAGCYFPKARVFKVFIRQPLMR